MFVGAVPGDAHRSTPAARMSAGQRLDLFGRRGNLRQPRIARLDALQPKTRLGHRDTAEPDLSVVERAERHVVLAGCCDVTGRERRQHVSQLAGGDVTPHADEARRAHRQPRQVQRVVTRVVGQPGLGHDHRAAVQIALGVLDGDDVRVRRERADGVPRDRHDRARRNVVEDHGQRGGVGDGGEVRDQTCLRRSRVVRRHDEQSVRSLGFACLGQVDAVRGVVAARARDDPGAVADRLEHGGQQRELLVVGGGGRFTRGAGEHQAVAPGVHQVRRQLLRGGHIERAVRAERRHHGSQHGAQACADVDSAGAHGFQDYPFGCALAASGHAITAASQVVASADVS